MRRYDQPPRSGPVIRDRLAHDETQAKNMRRLPSTKKDELLSGAPVRRHARVEVLVRDSGLLELARQRVIGGVGRSNKADQEPTTRPTNSFGTSIGIAGGFASTSASSLNSFAIARISSSMRKNAASTAGSKILPFASRISDIACSWLNGSL